MCRVQTTCSKICDVVASHALVRPAAVVPPQLAAVLALDLDVLLPASASANDAASLSLSSSFASTRRVTSAHQLLQEQYLRVQSASSQRATSVTGDVSRLTGPTSRRRGRAALTPSVTFADEASSWGVVCNLALTRCTECGVGACEPLAGGESRRLVVLPCGHAIHDVCV